MLRLSLGLINRYSGGSNPNISTGGGLPDAPHAYTNPYGRGGGIATMPPLTPTGPSASNPVIVTDPGTGPGWGYGSGWNTTIPTTTLPDPTITAPDPQTPGTTITTQNPPPAGTQITEATVWKTCPNGQQVYAANPCPTSIADTLRAALTPVRIATALVAIGAAFIGAIAVSRVRRSSSSTVE